MAILWRKRLGILNVKRMFDYHGKYGTQNYKQIFYTHVSDKEKNILQL